MKSANFYWVLYKHSENPDDELRSFCQDGHGVVSTEFSRQFFGFRTHVVATTVCATGGVHTLTCRTHIFLHMARAQSHPHIFMRVTYAQGSSVCEKVFCICVVSLHLAFSLLMSHPSFAVSVRRLSLSRLSSPHVLAVVSRPKSAGHAHRRTRTRSLALWPSPTSTQVMSPTSSTISLLWTATRCSLTITRTLDCSVFSQCWNPLFRTFLVMMLLFK